MTNEQARTDHGGNADPIDALLAETFERALSGPGNPTLVENVMATIVRRQRQRTLVLMLVGFFAAVICLLSAMPLLELLEGLTSGLRAGMLPPDAALGLPELLLLTLALVAGGWLLMEEAI